MPLIQMLYVSKAARPFLLDELRELVDQASRNNQERDITGMLLYGGGYFLQVLEGEPERVEALFTQISKDTRHVDVQSVLRVAVSRRSFDYWGMRLLCLEHATELNVERMRQLAAGMVDGAKARTHATAMLQCMRDFCAQIPATVSQAAGRDMISNLPV